MLNHQCLSVQNAFQMYFFVRIQFCYIYLSTASSRVSKLRLLLLQQLLYLLETPMQLEFMISTLRVALSFYLFKSR